MFPWHVSKMQSPYHFKTKIQQTDCSGSSRSPEPEPHTLKHEQGKCFQDLWVSDELVLRCPQASDRRVLLSQLPRSCKVAPPLPPTPVACLPWNCRCLHFRLDRCPLSLEYGRWKDEAAFFRIISLDHLHDCSGAIFGSF